MFVREILGKGEREREGFMVSLIESVSLWRERERVTVKLFSFQSESERSICKVNYSCVL